MGDNLNYLKRKEIGAFSNDFQQNEYDYLLKKPIGIVANSYDYVASHLSRNIGNTTSQYDGYGTPIGDLANPFYNSIVNTPWFFLDFYKENASNYLDYIRQTYGDNISIENINNNYSLRNLDIISIVGAVQTTAIENLFYARIPEDVSFINPNGFSSDTKLGYDGTRYVAQTLKNALKFNNKRKKVANIYGITNDLKNYFGLNSDAIENNVLYISEHNNGESYLSKGYYPSIIESPLEKSNYGNYTDLGVYTDFYESLGEDAKFHFEENVFGRGKKYYPKVTSRTTKADGTKKVETVKKDKTYLGSVGVSVGHDNLMLEFEKTNENGITSINIDELQVRYVFETLDEHSNITSINGGVYVYSENENGSSTNITNNSFNSGTRFGTYTSFGSGLSANDLLKKTNLAFKNGRYDTIIARFHTDSGKAVETDTTQTAVSKYGLSHGRNLLKKTPDKSQSYDNPYCRTWTYHHQYHRLADAIRPFQEAGEKGNVVVKQSELYSKYGFSNFSADNTKKGKDGKDNPIFENGRARLGKYGVTNQINGLVNIAPIDKKVDIRNCMFSIENLAWKDSWSSSLDEKKSFQNGGLSSEQKGPFGGRIMWFPPYDLKFNETTRVNWGTNSFIGRGEDIYTYKNTTRSGQLSFKLLIDHPSIINYWENRGRSSSNSVNDIDDPEQELLRFFAGCDFLSSKRAEVKKTEVVTEDEPIPHPKTEKYTFFVFFPNDYSGANDDANFAVEYLTNGVGAWKLKGGNDYRPAYSVAKDDNGKTIGGYEIQPNQSISVVSAQTQDNLIAKVKYGNEKEFKELYAQEGESSEHDWDCKWYYRVDNSNVDDKLKKKENYIDSGSNCLNSSAGKEVILKYFSVEDESKLFSFADMFVALSKNNEREVLKGAYNDTNVETITNEILSKKDKIKEIICTGQASIQGNSQKESKNDERNKELAENRAETMVKWLKEKIGISNIHKETISPQGEKTTDNVSDIANKIHRNARIDIYVSIEESATIQEKVKDTFRTHPIRPFYPNNKGIGEPTFIDNFANIYYDKRTLKNKETLSKLTTTLGCVDYLTFNLKKSLEENQINVNGVYNSIKNLTGASNILNKMNNGVSSLKNVEDPNTNEQELTQIKRYDNESKFFEMLEVEEPFLHQKISDKIKYFDPAFHSISPEGFNARLTFLQQCTRQGPTCGASDANLGYNTANNLAFGRPPVCILRIGDFYYTKIIIESIYVDFSDIKWDLNAEGIGVMPMMADVNMTFNYIGGSSLSGPISRLQSAVSFNAYANTEVYDNRSELAVFDEKGNISRLAPYNPSIND